MGFQFQTLTKLVVVVTITAEIAYSSIQQAKDFAVQPMVFLETSYTAVSFPVVELDVHNYIGDMMTEEAPNYIKQYHLSK